MIMGGMLYFLLFREAKLLGLIQNDVNPKFMDKFWKFKTIDMDVQGHIRNDNYEENTNSFLKDSTMMKEKYLKMMTHIFHKHENCFMFLHKILQNKPLSETEHDYIMNNNFGISMDVKIPFEKTGVLEYRPKIDVRIGDYNDHIFEALLLVNFDRPLINIYDLKCVEQPFVGENIVVSITQQIFPNERAWLQIKDFKSMSSFEIFKQMEDIFKHDKLAYLKFKQGYYRSYMMLYILQKAHEKQENRLLQIMLPTNEMLINKLFFFKSRTVSKITPKHIIDAAKGLSSELKKKSANKTSTPLDTIHFIKLCLSMWESYDKNIKV